MGRKSRFKKERNKKNQEAESPRGGLVVVTAFVVLVLAVASIVFWYSGGRKVIAPEKKIVEKTATIKTSIGNIKLKLYPEVAPKTVENFIKLAKEGFYNETKFHRVIPDFMIQGGDPLSKDESKKDLWGTGDPGYKFEDEINPWSLGLDEEIIKAYEAQGYKYRRDLISMKVEKGTIAMANSGPNTNGSQFFIVTTKEQSHLNGRHTVFGSVIEGLDIADKISRVDRDENDRPKENVTVENVIIEE